MSKLHMTRQPLDALDDLSPGDVIIRLGTDERYTVTAVGKRSVIVEHPNGGETLRQWSTMVDGYDVERPERLPAGLTRTYSDGFDFIDWAGDKGWVSFDTGWRGDDPNNGTGTPDARVLIGLAAGSGSLHIEADTLRFLIEQAEAYRARGNA